ncbi:MAG: RIP metalloprotease RseP [Alistipes senegalensis]|nr:RIP metalloprotease RseP [Oxalobacter formigenes]MCM1281194.1 RIP metalloprotease RseP [Alistipes senegalensis]
MIFLQTILAFLLALSALIVAHELGHYWVARLCNVKVLRFSLGMGKILFSRKFGPDQTEWALSALPMGGYVKLLDARTDDLSTLTPEERKREFTGKNVWCRVAIVVAGPLANFLLAIVLLAGLYMYGVPEPLARLRAVPENTVAWEAGLRGGERIDGINGLPVSGWQDFRLRLVEALMENQPVRMTVEPENVKPGDKAALKTVVLPFRQQYIGELDAGFTDRMGLALRRLPAVIGTVMPNGIAEKAGLREADRVVRVNGEPVEDGLAFLQKVRQSPGKPLFLNVVRGDLPVEITVVPESREEEEGTVAGFIQAEIPVMPEMVDVRYGFLTALGKGVTKAWDTSALTLKMVGKMFTGQVSVRNITGPVTIANYAGKTARAGLVRYLYFIAFISISIGMMNLLPIPVLDGGLLLYYAVEAISGRPIPEQAGEMAQRVGLALLVVLFSLAIFNDVTRLFG